MAYSSSAAAYGGTLGGAFRSNAVTDIVSQNEEANYTVVRFYGYMTRVATGNTWNFNPTFCNIQPTGGMTTGNVNGYDGRNSAGPWYGITEDRGFYHDANGNLTISHYFYHNASNSPYLGESATSHNLTLPSYYRFADPNYVELVSSTDVSLTWRVDANRLCDVLAVSLTGGGNWYYFYGDFYSTTVTIGSVASPLMSGATFPLRISLRRKNSGFWKEHGNWNVSTKAQGNFFDVGF
jgi:hypothetical protein